MTDVTSEKLYSKLNRINEIKRELKNVMINVGGYEYFESDPLFEEYPNILSQIHARIDSLNRILDISIYGQDPMNVLTKAQTTYKVIAPYLDELQVCRSYLIDNLNSKGVQADTNETLRSLVNKVKDIDTSSKTPFSETIYTTWLNDNFKVELAYCGWYAGSEWVTGLKCYAINEDDIDHDLVNPFYRLVFPVEGYGDYWVLLRSETVYSHSSIDVTIETIYDGEDTSKLDKFRAMCEEGSAHYSMDTFYRSNARIENLAMGDIGSTTLEVYQLNESTYFFWCTNRSNTGLDIEIDNNYHLYMYDPEDEDRYRLQVEWYAGDRLIDGSWIWLYYYPEEDEVDDFSHYQTNRFTIEGD